MAYKNKADAIKYNNEFSKKMYDHIHLTVSKGKKEAISAHALKKGETVNAFINRAIDETISREETEE